MLFISPRFLFYVLDCLKDVHTVINMSSAVINDTVIENGK